jgi:hypothetical protein
MLRRQLMRCPLVRQDVGHCLLKPSLLKPRLQLRRRLVIRQLPGTLREGERLLITLRWITLGLGAETPL